MAGSFWKLPALTLRRRCGMLKSVPRKIRSWNARVSMYVFAQSGRGIFWEIEQARNL